MAYSWEYDVVKILEEMELELVKSYKKHISKYTSTGAQSWKAKQLENLDRFRTESRDIIKHYEKLLNEETTEGIWEQYRKGSLKIFNKLSAPGDAIDLHIDNKRMAALLNAIHNDMARACHSALRKVNDVYRQNIFRAAVNFNSGTLTLKQSIDMASEQFLNRGIDSIEYKNGNKVDICSYSEMALRTNGHRAQVIGEAQQAQDYNVFTCYVSSHGITCAACAEYENEWLIDDVYSDGKPDKQHRTLSEAIAGGLFHPNCRHSLIYGIEDENIGAEKKEYSEEDAIKYENQQYQRQLEREIRKERRKLAGSCDAANIDEHSTKLKAKEKELKDFLKDKPYLIRQKERERSLTAP